MLRGMDVKGKKKTETKRLSMTHGNSGTVLTTDYAVSYVRFAVLIPRRLQKETISQALITPGFSFCPGNTEQREKNMEQRIMASALFVEQMNQAIDRQQSAIRSQPASFKYRDIEKLRKCSLTLMELITKEGDRNLTHEELRSYSLPLA
jgi:hypothetical protein